MPVFIHIPTNRLHVLEHSRHTNLLTMLVEHWLSGRSSVFGFDYRPCSRTSNATEFARRTDLVFRLAL